MRCIASHSHLDFWRKKEHLDLRMEIRCQDCASYLTNDVQLAKNQRKIRWVVAFSLIMMIGEISIGYAAGSMSLVAEGWHMGSHVGALTITLFAYWLAKLPSIGKKLSFGAGKLIPLGGYTSAIILGVVAVLVLIESVERLFDPVAIRFDEALLVAVAGLIVNVVSALILNVDHHGHSHDDHHRDHALDHDHHEHDHGDHDRDHHHLHNHVHDHNIRSAFLHVIADTVTSVLAISALLLGKMFNWSFLDPIVGIIGAGVIASWAIQLCRDTGWELLDGHSKTVDWTQLRELLENDGTHIVDFHMWRIAPKALACELIVTTKSPRGHDHYKSVLRKHFSARHIVVEERIN
ncbi:MAG: cation transporter [Verrucomicrobia bacterium]|nr:MAG: cation transporter [Verrucomicrobiota bacterium]